MTSSIYELRTWHLLLSVAVLTAGFTAVSFLTSSIRGRRSRRSEATAAPETPAIDYLGVGWKRGGYGGIMGPYCPKDGAFLQHRVNQGQIETADPGPTPWQDLDAGELKFVCPRCHGEYDLDASGPRLRAEYNKTAMESIYEIVDGLDS